MQAVQQIKQEKQEPISGESSGSSCIDDKRSLSHLDAHNIIVSAAAVLGSSGTVSPDDPNNTEHSTGGVMVGMKRKAKSKDDKICSVCGDKALGCNFDAISCESCKAFFRRNALKEKITKCIFNGNCQIDMNTRRFCPHCRLAKCFTVGMRKDLILDEDAKRKRSEKVKTNRIKRCRTTGPTICNPASQCTISPTSTPPISPSNLTVPISPMCDMVNNNEDAEACEVIVAGGDDSADTVSQSMQGEVCTIITQKHVGSPLPEYCLLPNPELPCSSAEMLNISPSPTSALDKQVSSSNDPLKLEAPVSPAPQQQHVIAAVTLPAPAVPGPSPAPVVPGPSAAPSGDSTQTTNVINSPVATTNIMNTQVNSTADQAAAGMSANGISPKVSRSAASIIGSVAANIMSANIACAPNGPSPTAQPIPTIPSLDITSLLSNNSDMLSFLYNKEGIKQLQTQIQGISWLPDGGININFTTTPATSTSQASTPEAGSSTQAARSTPETANTLSALLGSNNRNISDILGLSFIPSDANREKVYRSLNNEENNAILELQQIYDLSFTVDLEPLVHIKQLDPSLNQLVNQSSITVLRLIKFAKRLDAFSALSQHCQIGMLKGVWLKHLLLRSVSLYDTERDVWVTPRGDIPTEILKNATGYVKLHDDHVNYCKSFKAIIGDDLTIVILLLLTLIFSPDGPHVVDHQLVSDTQDKYLTLLKHYLEAKYSFSNANTMFGQLMEKLMELKKLAEVHGKYLLDLNPNDIEPIMLEILDLK